MMDNLELEPAMRRAVNSAIVISGGARSGTTILGKLIHSLKDVEYAFEPPTLIALFANLDSMPEALWRFLYEVYLSEEFLANALAGRSINTNRADDTSIMMVKARPEIEQRLAHSWGKRSIIRAAAASTIAYKIPNIVPVLGRFHLRYPDSRIIIIKRGFSDTAQSIIKKGWFRNSMSGTSVLWPFRVFNGFRVPYWVAEGDDALWCNLNEVDRCAYYYLRMNFAPPEGENVLYLRYSSLVSQPERTASHLVDWLKLSPGEMTPEVIKSIIPSVKPVEQNIIDEISPRFRSEVKYQSRQSE